MIIVDNKVAYSGSANLTGAGLGAKSKNRRNFEIGFVCHDQEQIQKLNSFYQAVYSGEYCSSCERRMVCPDPIN